MRRLGLAGWSGAGKTTLVRALIPELNRLGVTVSTVKHAHHSFDVDQPGKDSYEHRMAGAAEVMVTSRHRWALMHELRGAEEPDLDALVAHMTPVDLLLIEGFKRVSMPKLEVHRPSLGKPLMAREDPDIVAVASDEPVAGLVLPRLDLAAVPDIARLVLAMAR